MEAVETFLIKLKNQGHVLPLIQQADIQVNLRCEEQTIQLIIKNRNIMILKNQEAKNEISGTPASMKQLLDGTERLRVLEQRGQLKVSAPLRAALLLESLFFLTKAHDSQLAKII